jgi:type IV secretion system protein VirD4
MADMVIFDPKGEHAKDTFQRRCSAEFLTAQGIAHDGTTKHLPYGEAHVLDPCGITGRKSARHTLLSEIDINAPNCRELIVAIADGCILPEAEKNKWFEEVPKSLLQGLIAYVLGRFPDEPGKQTLPHISDLVYGVNEDGFSDPALFNELLLDMMTCNVAGGLPQQAASELLKMGERERGQVLSALARGLKWVGDPAMRVQLSHSDFSFSEIGCKTVIGADGSAHKAPMTVYIVLPDTRISDLNRWFRCVASLGSVAMRRRPVLPDLATLWIMDEFALLGGGLKTISDGYGLFAGYKIKLWIFLQNLGQLQHDYPERWNAMIGNANAQFFGISMMDTVTAKFISEAAGRLNRVRTEGRHGLLGLFRRRTVSETPREILTPSEVATLIGKGSNKQIFFPANDGHPVLLERLVFRPMKVGGRKLNALPLDGLRGHFNDF